MRIAPFPSSCYPVLARTQTTWQCTAHAQACRAVCTRACLQSLRVCSWTCASLSHKRAVLTGACERERTPARTRTRSLAADSLLTRHAILCACMPCTPTVAATSPRPFAWPSACLCPSLPRVGRHADMYDLISREFELRFAIRPFCLFASPLCRCASLVLALSPSSPSPVFSASRSRPRFSPSRLFQPRPHHSAAPLSLSPSLTHFFSPVLPLDHRLRLMCATRCHGGSRRISLLNQKLDYAQELVQVAPTKP